VLFDIANYQNVLIRVPFEIGTESRRHASVGAWRDEQPKPYCAVVGGPAQHREGERFSRRLVLRGSEERLAPILMTALATGLALVPIIIGGNRPGQEIKHPMAVVIVGGLFTSTLLNLFLMPAMYLLLAAPRNRGDHVPPSAGNIPALRFATTDRTTVKAEANQTRSREWSQHGRG